MKGDKGHRRVNRPPGHPTYETLVDNMLLFAQPAFKPTPEEKLKAAAEAARREAGVPKQLEFDFMREMPLARAPAQPR